MSVVPVPNTAVRAAPLGVTERTVSENPSLVAPPRIRNTRADLMRAIDADDEIPHRLVVDAAY